MALVLLVATVTPAMALYDPATDGDVDPVANPDFPQLCGVNVIILIDNSASLNEGNLTDIKAAANSTVDALSATGSVSGVGIVSFNQRLDGSDGADTRIAITPLDSSANVSAVKDAIGGIQLPESETLTNWEAAFLEASQSENDGDGDVADENLYKPADVVVMVTDGRPNAYGYDGSFAATGLDDAREAATLGANVVKGEGSRVIGVGFPDSNGNVPAATPFEAITDGASSIDHTESSDAQAIDYYLADSSGQVSSILLGIAGEVDCGIALEKLNDANVDATFTDDETAPAPGDAVTYQVNVTNTGKIDLVVDSYADDQYGVPAVSPGLIGETIAAGSSIVVTFQGVAPEENGVKVNVFNVTAVDADGYELDAQDDAIVRSPDLTPSISVEKQNDANADSTFTDDETSALPGDAVTYLVTVTNDGPNNVTIDSFDDDVYTGLVDANLNQSLVGVSLAPGESIAVTFVGSSPVDEDQSKVNTFNVSASDADGDVSAAEDDTTVRSPDLTPSLDVQKLNDANDDGTFSDDETSAMPGDAVTYLVTVTNDGPNNVTIGSYSDDIYGVPTLNQTLNGVTLAPGESIAVTFVGSSPVDEDQSKVNVFNVTGSDADGDDVSDEDDTTVRSSDLTPVISVEKQNDANADSSYSDDETTAQPGDAVTYLVTVTNDGPNNVTIDSFGDDVYTGLSDADLNQSLVGVSLAPGESIAVTFVGSSPSTEDTAKINTFDVSASDADGDVATDDDDTTVRSPDLTPSISVEKLVDGDDADATFEDVEFANQSSAATYLVTVTNDGPNNVSLTSFSDDVYTGLADGDLNQSLVGVSLAPGESIAVTFDGSAPDLEGDSKVNTFTVNAQDADGDTASDFDDATITAYDLTPSISVEKLVDAQDDDVFADSEEAANPDDTVTYMVIIVNDGPNDVTFDSYSDDIYGVPTLNQTLLGVTLAPGEFIVVTFDGTAPSAFDDSKTNVFTADASDEDGDTTSDFDDATVTTPPALDICPRTPGFWSTHNGDYAEGNNMDFTTDKLPIALGDGSGKSVIVDSDDVANDIFESQLTADSAKNNGVSKLYIHLLAAKLNTANGASAPQEVLDAIERSDQILTDYDESDWDDVKKNDKELAQEIEDLKDVLDQYNNRAFTGENCVEDWWQEEVTA